MIKRILSTALFVLATSATMLSQNVALKTNAYTGLPQLLTWELKPQ